ncbi:hypothetical protein B0H14DRAFT_2563651 [Mycena olivaceomarginata]|nr:hypothetical protein B0H14DRAFT_2563651 [Mycena olivaceomarginata]
MAPGKSLAEWVHIWTVEFYWYRLNWLARDLVLVPRIWKPALRLCWSQPPVAASDIATVATSAVSTPRTENKMCAGLAVASVATRHMAENFLMLDDIFPNKMCAALAVASVATRHEAEKILILDEMSASVSAVVRVNATIGTIRTAERHNLRSRGHATLGDYAPGPYGRVHEDMYELGPVTSARSSLPLHGVHRCRGLVAFVSEC